MNLLHFHSDYKISDKKLNQYRIIHFWFGGMYVWIEKKCMKSSQAYKKKKVSHTIACRVMRDYFLKFVTMSDLIQTKLSI